MNKPTRDSEKKLNKKRCLMEFNYNKDYVSLAQGLRKNMTPEEKHLWYDFLKRLPITVNDLKK